MMDHHLDDDDIDGCEGHLRIVASAKRKRTSQIFTSDDDETSCDDNAPISTLMKRTSQIFTSDDDETSCDDKAPISTLMRSRKASECVVREDASRRGLTSAKSKRAGKISDDDDETEDNGPISAIKTRYRSKCTTGSQSEVQEDSRRRRLIRLRKSENKNEEDDKNSFDLKNSVCLQESSSSDDEEDNDALEDGEDYDGLEDEEDCDGVQDTEDVDGLEDEEDDDDSVEDDGEYDGLEDEEDNDCPVEEEDYDDEQDEEDDDGSEEEEDYDDEQDEEDDDPEEEEDYDDKQDEEADNSVEEDDDGDSANKSENAIVDNEQDMDQDQSVVHSPNTISAKTKRVSKIIVSDDEISYDDNSLTTTLRTQHNTRLSSGYEDEVNDDASKQCPTTPTESVSGNKQEDESSCDLNQTIRLDTHSSSDEEDNDGPEEGSASEHDSLGGFIVYSHDEDEVNDADDFKAILGEIGRQNVSNVRWDFEGEMLADFGKDPELCMRAVCALYRQQTADEKASKEARYRNGRGFSQVDAFRGGVLAEFLTDGDLTGNLNKTVEELKQHNPEWVKLCKALAAKYSKQLFQIYQNKEDPYFLPE